MSLDILGWGKVSDFLTSVIDRVVPDPAQKIQATLALAQLEQNGEFKLLDTQVALIKTQTDINLADAQSGHFWQSGARPAILWTCALGFLYQLILCPALTWFSLNLWHLAAFPTIDANSLETTMWALLGISGMRSADKGTFQGLLGKK